MRHSPEWLALKLFAFIRGSHNRRRIWESPEQFYKNYRKHPTFRRFTAQSMDDYAQHVLKQRADGQYELRCHPHWESTNFRKVQFLWQHLKKVTQPTLLIRAEHSYLYKQETFKRYTLRCGEHITHTTLDNCYHLLTHEQPELVAKTILEWLD